MLILCERCRSRDPEKEHQIHVSLPALLWGICSSGMWDRISHTIYILPFPSFFFWQRKESWVWTRTSYVLRKNSVQKHNVFWEGQPVLEQIAESLLLLHATARSQWSLQFNRRDCLTCYGHTQNQEEQRSQRADAACHGFSAFALLACWFAQWCAGWDTLLYTLGCVAAPPASAH